MMKRKREDKDSMDIVWQTPANPPLPQDYIFRNGIRYVRPYYFEFIAHVKNRWAGKTIVDLFAEEFKGRPYDYYVSAVKCGRIQVDGEMVPVSYVVKSSQKISHFLHRHEPPVMACEVPILLKESDVLTVCKPASVPLAHRFIHAVNIVRTLLLASFKQSMGWLLCFVSKNFILEVHYMIVLKRSIIFPMSLIYSFSLSHFAHLYLNTSLSIFLYLYFLEFIHFVLAIFLDTIISAVHRLDRLVSGLLIMARNASKADSFRQEIEAGLVKKQYIAKVVGEFPENELIVDANIDYNAREGRSTAEVRDSAKGKVASTKFTRISCNGTHSIVLCEPVTGRTHQIRVHLQYSGHPIANDMLYISEQPVDRSISGSAADRSAHISNASLTSNFGEKVPNKCQEDSNEDFGFDSMCTNCPNLAPKGYDGDEEGLWLHCMRYSGPGWTYECPYPDWAKL